MFLRSTPPETRWQPLLTPPLIDSAWQSIFGIAEALKSFDAEEQSPSQLAATALFFGYLSRAEPAGPWGSLAVSVLNTAADRFSASRTGEALFGGLSGVAWVFEHLGVVLAETDGEHALSQSVEGIEEDGTSDDPVAEVDQLLLARLRKPSWSRGYDLISGWAGLGIYFLERYPRESALEALNLILSGLEETARPCEGGVAWFTPPEELPEFQREACPLGHFNLGVAHGLPGVVVLLAELIARGVQVRRARELFDGAVKCLFAVQHPKEMETRFGSWFAPGESPRNSRFGWCYGDLGIGACLARAGRLGDRHDLTFLSTQILRECADRPVTQPDIADPGLCHGALGVAHIFARAFLESAEESSRAAALRWYERGLSQRLESGGFAGYFSWRPLYPDPREPDASFLTGAVGIGLALLAGVAPIEPEWDRLLLLSGIGAPI